MICATLTDAGGGDFIHAIPSGLKDFENRHRGSRHPWLVCANRMLPVRKSGYVILILVGVAFADDVRVEELKSPDGRIAFKLSDGDGLTYSVAMEGKPVLAESRLGLEFREGDPLGPKGGGRGFATTDCWCRESCVEFRL